MQTLYVSVIALALVGCVSTGTQVKDSALTQFHNGVTTEADIVKALGPAQSVTTVNGRRFVSYIGVHAQAKASTFIPIVGAFVGGASSQASSVTFRFGQDGKLIDYSSTQSNVGSVSGLAAGYQPSAPAPAVKK